VIFVKHKKTTATTLRGDDLARQLGVPCISQESELPKNDVVILVKYADAELVKTAKKLGNTIVYDVVDHLCKDGVNCMFSDLVDILLVPNRVCIRYYSTIFANAEFKVIPHQWDNRLICDPNYDEFRVGYIGEELNLSERRFTGPKVTVASEMIPMASKFNCHLSLPARMAKIAMLKPATKISTAAAVGANVIAFPDPSALEILPEDYPFYCNGDPMEAIDRAKSLFNSPVWHKGLEMMVKVKEQTSIASIAALYDFKRAA
jgi:hypothetical protein